MNLYYVPQKAFRGLSPKEVARACRINALFLVTFAGKGHLGSSLSAMEGLMWAYSYGTVIPSKGHDTPAHYAIMHSIGKLCDGDLFELRRGLPAHPEVPLFPCNTGSLGMGLSKAMGMIGNRLVVTCGDGELQEGQFWEAARFGPRPGLKLLIDWNGWQQEQETGSILPAYTVMDMLETLGWSTYLCEGHSFRDLQRAEKYDAIIAHTTKGKGISFMEDNYRWHFGAPNGLEYEQALRDLRAGDFDCRVVPFEPTPSGSNGLIAAYGLALRDAFAINKNLMALDADTMKDHALLGFPYQDRLYEVGISEQHMVSLASGMALSGFLPICHSYAAFLVRRAADQIANQVLEGTKVIYVASSAGRLPANGPGPSHEELHDAEIMRYLGVENIYTPKSPREVAKNLGDAISGSGSAYIRLEAI